MDYLNKPINTSFIPKMPSALMSLVDIPSMPRQPQEYDMSKFEGQPSWQITEQAPKEIARQQRERELEIMARNARRALPAPIEQLDPFRHGDTIAKVHKFEDALTNFKQAYYDEQQKALENQRTTADARLKHQGELQGNSMAGRVDGMDIPYYGGMTTKYNMPTPEEIANAPIHSIARLSQMNTQGNPMFENELKNMMGMAGTIGKQRADAAIQAGKNKTSLAGKAMDIQGKYAIQQLVNQGKLDEADRKIITEWQKAQNLKADKDYINRYNQYTQERRELLKTAPGDLATTFGIPEGDNQFFKIDTMLQDKYGINKPASSANYPTQTQKPTNTKQSNAPKTTPKTSKNLEPDISTESIKNEKTSEIQNALKISKNQNNKKILKAELDRRNKKPTTKAASNNKRTMPAPDNFTGPVYNPSLVKPNIPVQPMQNIKPPSYPEVKGRYVPSMQPVQMYPIQLPLR